MESEIELNKMKLLSIDKFLNFSLDCLGSWRVRRNRLVCWAIWWMSMPLQEVYWAKDRVTKEELDGD